MNGAAASTCLPQTAPLRFGSFVLDQTGERLLCAGQRSRVPQVEASMLKVRGTELRQAIFETLLDIAGPHALPFSAEAQFLESLGDMPAPPELGGPKGLEPIRFGDWERKGIAVDF